jgi:hypothetical protein
LEDILPVYIPAAHVEAAEAKVIILHLVQVAASVVAVELEDILVKADLVHGATELVLLQEEAAAEPEETVALLLLAASAAVLVYMVKVIAVP